MGRGYCVGMVEIWQGLVLPAIPSTSLRAITPRQGGHRFGKRGDGAGPLDTV
jgi:hypothetical protein